MGRGRTAAPLIGQWLSSSSSSPRGGRPKTQGTPPGTGAETKQTFLMGCPTCDLPWRVFRLCVLGRPWAAVSCPLSREGGSGREVSLFLWPWPPRASKPRPIPRAPSPTHPHQPVLHTSLRTCVWAFALWLLLQGMQKPPFLVRSSEREEYTHVCSRFCPAESLAARAGPKRNFEGRPRCHPQRSPSAGPVAYPLPMCMGVCVVSFVVLSTAACG